MLGTFSSKIVDVGHSVTLEKEGTHESGNCITPSYALIFQFEDEMHSFSFFPGASTDFFNAEFEENFELKRTSYLQLFHCTISPTTSLI